MKTFQFQNLKQKDYFEGWYFRFSNEKTNENYAVIFAITKNQEDPHSFIQVFKDSSKECEYQRFDVDDFSYDKALEQLTIKDNVLSTNKAVVNSTSIQLDLSFKNTVSLDGKSAMGYLSHVPLQCFQEVIFIDGEASGTIKDTSVEGKIYIEKTYGSKFPIRWIWIQSNHSENGSSMSFSVGIIPFTFFMGNGFLFYLKTPKENFHFYTGNLSKLTVKDEVITIKKGKFKVLLKPKSKNIVKLVGPSHKALMNLDVFESIDSTLLIEVYKNDEVIFKDTYTNVGYENMW